MTTLAPQLGLAAAHPLHRLLPVPGPVWGDAPSRAPGDAAPPRRAWRWRGAAAQARRVAAQAAAAASSLAQAASSAAATASASANTAAAATAGASAAATATGGANAAAGVAARSCATPAELASLRAALRREGLTPALQARALGAAAAAAARTLGVEPYPGQLLAAALLLDQRMAEMATGEGKTLATALAAAAAALAGVPVHVVTANDYLAARDAVALAPLYAALGLRVAHLDPALPAPGKRAAYRADVLYATARELAFDWLRDHLAGAQRGPLERCAARLAGMPAAADEAPLQRGLAWAMLDEADSILLDEADLPLIVSRPVPNAARRAWLWQALALARQLVEGEDFALWPLERRAVLSAAGRARLAQRSAPLSGPWARARWRDEAVQTALVGLHLLQRDHHYVLRDGAVELLDEVSGRAAPGRVWSRGLHAVVEMKEGLAPSAETETLARTTFQRFFQRYWRLAGTSGTLREARAELREVFGIGVLRVPLHRPLRRAHWPATAFASRESMFDAAAARCRELAAAGRPVLVGTDSVEDSEALALRLQAAGVAHRVLNARHDADEAAIVAAAGRAGAVTVATRMAGRGTDIALDDAARAAGGLHALGCQLNPSRRLDRQFAGRAGRHGDPGSAEAFVALPSSSAWAATPITRIEPWKTDSTPSWPARCASWLVLGWLRARQWRDERRRRALRALLREQDRRWDDRLAFAGPAS